MTITIEKALLNNQSILQNFAFGEEIDEQSAEIISGGCDDGVYQPYPYPYPSQPTGGIVFDNHGTVRNQIGQQSGTISN